MDFNAIPESLRSLKQWVCWRYEQRDDAKPTKVPVTIGGYRAASTEPADWYSFDDVCEAAHKFDGIGFVFSVDDPFLGIDLDDCLTSPGELKPWAAELLEQLDGTYAEVSPSGNGIKVICRAVNPLDRGRKVAVEDGGIELYDRGRFFTITGNVWDDAKPSDKQPAVNWLAQKYFSEPTLAIAASGPLVSCDHTKKVARAQAYLDTMEPSISGSGGHAVCFRAACKLVIGFDLDTETAYSLLTNGYNSRCQPPWSEKELRHKVESAAKEPGDRGYMLTERASETHHPGVDLAGIIGNPTTAEEEPAEWVPDDEFCLSMVPKSGLIKDIFDYYWAAAYKRSPVLGLAIATSVCQTIFGRRVESHTALRTNDYNIVIAATGSGKDACESTSQKIIEAGLEAIRRTGQMGFIIPPDMQSGNALMREISELRCGLWICDEFGKVLEVILD
ncbi:MAG: hypothetical protein ACO1RT_03340, partial [Planctomycetaceae bacterium]